MSGGILIVGMIFGRLVGGGIWIVGMIFGRLVGEIFGRVGNGASVLVGCGVTVAFSNGVGLGCTEFSVG